MILVQPDSMATGDTARIRWELPAGARVLRGPTASDSLSVRADTLHPGQWTVQPFSPGRFGGDTLQAIGPQGDTLTESVQTWNVRSRIQGSDSAAASLLPPQQVPVPFPWDVVGWVSLGLLLALLAVWAWSKRKKRAPKPPPVPPRDPLDVCRERLDEIAASSEAGTPARETAFACGELLRELHGALHGWKAPVESTSLEWRNWTRANRPEPERFALDDFLAQADALRYADASTEAGPLLAEARLLLEAIGRHRAEVP
jgi:hypothetical protein